MDFKGKTALVTGSSAGIGAAAAIAFAKEGADVILVSRNVPKLQAVQKEIELLGRKATIIEADVSSDESVAAMQARALKDFKDIDILVNNAGTGIRGPLTETTMDDWRNIVNINLFSQVRVVQAFLPYFLERGRGYIVNVSSIQAMGYGMEDTNTPYIATKAGIIGFTDCISTLLRPKGILVSCLIPGGVITDIASNSIYIGTKDKQKEMRDHDIIATKSPMFLTAEQCASGLVDGMKQEQYMILTPPRMAGMLKAQGRDMDVFNAFVKNWKPREK